MNINPSKFKNPYLRLELGNGTAVIVKLDDEGVVIDHVDQNEDVIDSTWKTYQEMEDGDEE